MYFTIIKKKTNKIDLVKYFDNKYKISMIFKYISPLFNIFVRF